MESVYACATEECGQAAQYYGMEQILTGLQRLRAANDRQTFKPCKSDPKTRSCISEGVCNYVQAGPFPGFTCLKSGTVIAPLFDNIEKRIRFQGKSKGGFWWVPSFCVTHGVTVTAHSIDEIVCEDEPAYCNWMIVGNSTNTFSFAVESVDFDRGIIGGYWTVPVVPAAGLVPVYGVLVLPKAMPRGENWLVAPLKK